MTVLTSGTLDANGEAFTFTINPGAKAKVRMDISPTITVTADDGGSAFEKSPGNNAAWTASDSIILEGPGTFTFTASGVESGGTCDYEVTAWKF